MEITLDEPRQATKNAASVKTVASSIRIRLNYISFDHLFTNCASVQTIILATSSDDTVRRICYQCTVVGPLPFVKLLLLRFQNEVSELFPDWHFERLLERGLLLYFG